MRKSRGMVVAASLAVLAAGCAGLERQRALGEPPELRPSSELGVDDSQQIAEGTVLEVGAGELVIALSEPELDPLHLSVSEETDFIAHGEFVGPSEIRDGDRVRVVYEKRSDSRPQVFRVELLEEEPRGWEA
jgi:hypothetical protein